MAQQRGIALEGRGDARKADYMKKIGFEDLGYQIKYETMVFKAVPAPEGKEEDCCPYRMESGAEEDMLGYNNPGDAFRGHMLMCEKWSKKK